MGATTDGTTSLLDDLDQDAPAVDRWLLGLTALSVVVGVVARFAPRSDLWLDEALSVNIARLPLDQIPDALRQDGHPPLYYVLLHLWTVVDTSNWWVRALSGVIALSGLPLAYLVGRRIGSRVAGDGLGARRTGLLMLAAYAVVPYGVRYGAETRMYALVIVEVLAGYLLVDNLWSGRTTGRRRAGSAAGLALVTASLLWTHYWSLWLVCTVGLVALWQSVRSHRPTTRTGARWSVAALVGGGLLFAPWLPTMLYQSAHTGTPWGKPFRPTTMLLVAVVDFAGGSFAEAQLLSYVLVGLVVAGLVVRAVRDPSPHLVLGGRPLPRVRAEMGIVLVTLGLAWAVSSVSGGTFASRYASVVYPLFLAAVAAGMALARSPRTTAVVLAVVLAGSSVACAVEVTNDRSQSGVVAERILADEPDRAGGSTQPPPAVVVVCPDQLGPSVGRALANRSPSGWPKIVPFPDACDPDRVDWVDYKERNAAADPAEFVADVTTALPPQTTVYLAYNTSFTTFEGKCEGVAAALAQDRDPEQLVSGDADNFYEGFSLTAFRPRS
ncbi:MAG: hypothetical protein ACKO04_09255 [Actinomycetes bacterium]